MITCPIVGFWTNITLLRSYAATASTGSDRSKAIAFVTGGMAMGTITGPALQLIFVPLGPKGFHLYGDLNFSIYTAPAAAACIIDIIGALLVHFFFVENMIGVSFTPTNKEEATTPTLPPYDKVAVAICYFTRFCQLLVITNFEAIGTPLAMTMFAWNAPQVVRYGAIANFCASILAFGIYAVYIKFNLGRIISSRKITMFSLFGLLILFLTTYSWPFLPGHLEVYNENGLLK
uniref:Uncharacterized protein n=1 Tax=Panagrolaimus sp. ES5 TaxID=591445 RepID=A0AC34F6S2_9BILA